MVDRHHLSQNMCDFEPPQTGHCICGEVLCIKVTLPTMVLTIDTLGGWLNNFTLDMYSYKDLYHLYNSW